MIDAGTISASLILDTQPFAKGIDKALDTIASLGILSDSEGGKVSTLGDVLAKVGGRVGTEFRSPFAVAAQAVTFSCNTISDAVGKTALNVSPAAVRIKNNILSPLRETVSSGNTIMKNFGQGLINGLASKQAAIIAKARAIANSVTSAMKKALGIASPSRVMRRVGQFTAEGMILGLEDMSTEVQRASAALAQSAAVPASVQAEKQSLPELFGNETAAMPEIKEKGGTAQDTLSRKLDTLIDLLSNGRQSIELDRRTFGVLVREYT